MRNQAVVTWLFAFFGFALLCTGCALGFFLAEILLASRGLRDQMAAAGNVGGEVLNWIAMLSAIGPAPATTIEIGPRLGDGYGFWAVQP